MRAIRTTLGILLTTLLLSCGSGRGPAAKPTEASELIDLDLREASMHDALVELGRKAHVNFSLDPDVSGTVTLSVRAQPWRDVLDTIVKDHQLKVERLAHPKGVVLRISSASTPAPAEQTFSGAPMTASFDGVPIRTVAKAFAEFAGVEIVVDDDVQATVTELMHEVPWDLALDHIVRKYNLRIVRTGNQLRIATP